MTTHLVLGTKSPKNKQEARFSITNIINLDLRKLLKKFKNSLYLGYKRKKVHNELTEAYFFLINNMSKLIKIKMQVRIHNREVISDVDGTKRVNKRIVNVNEKIQYIITLMNGN